LGLDVSPLLGEEVSSDRLAQIVRAVTEDLETFSDLHATASYRKRVAAVLGQRALESAFSDARRRSGGMQ
jgi:carbon-monoxide dehydrogenase medium subunit